MQAIKFKNFSEEKFVWNWDGTPYSFEAGQEMYLEDFKAHHFAKHLINRELDKRGMATNDQAARAQFQSECFPGDTAVSPVEALQIEEEKKATKKRGSSKKKTEVEEEKKATKKRGSSKKKTEVEEENPDFEE